MRKNSEDKQTTRFTNGRTRSDPATSDGGPTRPNGGPISPDGGPTSPDGRSARPVGHSTRPMQMGQQGQVLGQMGQAQMLGPDPIWMTCPNCKTEIFTTTRKSTRTFQCLIVGFLCCVVRFCFCIWKDVLHACPKCNYVIGKYKKWGQALISPVSMSINYFSVWELLSWIKYNTLFQLKSTKLFRYPNSSC